MTLRPYQTEAVLSALAELRDRYSTLIVLPTGAGKTVVFTEIAKRWQHGRVLILAHREELVNQAAEKVFSATGEKPAIEMADQSEVPGYGSSMFGQSPIVVGSVQSVCRPNRLARMDQADFGLLIVDEAHHCTPQNSSYQAILEHFKKNADCKLIGVTATPDRSDKLALGQVFESVAYEMTILDAIEGGWLCNIEQQFVTVQGLDFSKVRTIAGDLSETDLDNLMNADGGRLLHEIASATVQAAQEEPTLIFANSVGSAEAIAKIINRYPEKRAVCLHGKTPKEERRYWLAEYAKGNFQYLVGCDLFLEGFDSPRISVVSNAKPTKSRSRYTQCVGRGTRILPGIISDSMTVEERLAAIASSVKPRCLVLDFVGNAAQHKLISSADILGGRYVEAAKIKAVAQAQEDGEPVDMRQAMAKATKDIADEEERQRRLQEKREAEERERKEREWLRAQAKFETERVDGFGVVGGASGIRFSANGKVKGPTPRMVELLRDNGVDASEMTYAEASEAISNLKQFWDGTLCSPKQSQILEKFGENPRATRDQAKVLIDLIVANGWKQRSFKLTRDRWRIGKGQDGKFYPIVVTEGGKVPISAKFGSESQCRDFISKVIESN